MSLALVACGSETKPSAESNTSANTEITSDSETTSEEVNEEKPNSGELLTKEDLIEAAEDVKGYEISHAYFENPAKAVQAYFKENGIRLKVIDLPTTMMDLPEGQEWVFEMVNNILIEVLGTIAEQERATIKQRQAEGIAAAKEQGKKLGRPALTFPANWDKVYASWKAGEITAKKAMELTETKRTSFYKLVSLMDEE